MCTSTWSGNCLLNELILRRQIVDHRDSGFALMISSSITTQCNRYISFFISTSINQNRILRMINARIPVDHSRITLMCRAKNFQYLSRFHSSSSYLCFLFRIQRSNQFSLKIISNPVYLLLNILRHSQSSEKSEFVPLPEDTPLLTKCFSDFF